jgi:DNA repair ATPase RecN
MSIGDGTLPRPSGIDYGEIDREQLARELADARKRLQAVEASLRSVVRLLRAIAAQVDLDPTTLNQAADRLEVGLREKL